MGELVRRRLASTVLDTALNGVVEVVAGGTVVDGRPAPRPVPPVLEGVVVEEAVGVALAAEGRARDAATAAALRAYLQLSRPEPAARVDVRL